MQSNAISQSMIGTAHTLNRPPVGAGAATPVQAVHGLALLLLIPVGLYMVFFPVFRPLGEAVLGTVLLFCLVSTLIIGRLHLPLGLGILLATSLPILFLSFYQAMPPAWTRYHSDFAAFRQWLWIPMAVVFLNNARFFWYKCYEWVQRNALRCAIGFYIASRLAMSTTGELAPIDISLYHVSATTTPIVLFLAIWLLTNKRPAWQDFVIFVIFAPAMTSQTHFLGWTICYLCRLLPARIVQLMPAVIAVSLLLFLLVAPQFSRALHELDGNTGVRSVLWGHAQNAAIQSYGLGVGFGTEYFPNDFRQITSAKWTLTGEAHVDRLYVSTHSALYDTILRMGLFGLAGLLLWLGKYIRTPLSIYRDGDIRLISGLASMLLFILAFNPGLVTVYILMVAGLIMGLLDILAYRSAVAFAQDGRSV